MNDRIEKLLQFLKEDPDDAFTKYALAIEYTSTDKSKAILYFEDLLKNHREYIGTYYHAAHLYVELDNPDKAKEVFEKGIEVAEKLKNHHALRELKAAYQNFLYEN
jgi:tetratricopeptide (TPR) repeat protein